MNFSGFGRHPGTMYFTLRATDTDFLYTNIRGVANYCLHDISYNNTGFFPDQEKSLAKEMQDVQIQP